MVGKEVKQMNKWIAIPVIALLVIGIVVMAVIMTQQTGKLREAESKIAALEGEVSTLEKNGSTLEKNALTLQTKLDDSEAKASTLQASLNTANTEITALQDSIKSQQSAIAVQAEELKKVRSPRHFSSLAELTSWLQKDDTDTRYAYENGVQRAFILQVRALRDGYLLPVCLPRAGVTEYVFNTAVIGDIVYAVQSSNDSVERWAVAPLMPAYPILP